MSRLRDLIDTLCPVGVPFLELGELLIHEQPGRYLVETTNYDDSFDTPVLTAGQTFVLGYTDERTGIYEASHEKPVIIFDDFTTSLKWVDFPFKAKSSAMKMLTPRAGGVVEFRFVFYVMMSLRYRPQDHARQWISRYSTLRIPVPPIEVQREVVGVLDRLSGLQTELDFALRTELDSRGLQQSQVRATALAELVEANPSFRLDEVVDFTNGKAHEKFVDPEGEIALLTARYVSTNGRSARFVKRDDVLSPAREGDIAMVMSDLPNGRALARCFYVDQDDVYTANQRVCLLRVQDLATLSPRFLFHCLDRNIQLLAHDNGQDQTHLKKGDVLDVLVPLPPIAEQLRIAAAFDSLGKTAAELNEMLSGERNSRRTQYEYYRNQALSFREVAV